MWSHEVSILMALVGAVGRWRGVAPRSKTSMMIMRPPQHGQGGLSVSPTVSVGSFSQFLTASSSRACDVGGAGPSAARHDHVDMRADRSVADPRPGRQRRLSVARDLLRPLQDAQRRRRPRRHVARMRNCVFRRIASPQPRDCAARSVRIVRLCSPDRSAPCARLAAAQRQLPAGMQLVPVIAIRIGAVGSISGPAVAVKRVLAKATGMTGEAEVLAAEPGAAAKTSPMAHAAEMRAAAKARMCRRQNRHRQSRRGRRRHHPATCALAAPMASVEASAAVARIMIARSWKTPLVSRTLPAPMPC